MYDLNLIGFIYELPVVCSNGGIQTFDNVVFPIEGEFNGLGVTQGSTQGSFNFDPTIAGIGTHTVSYTVDSEVYTSLITVAAPILPILSLPDTLMFTTPALANIQGTGTPLGGVYYDDQGIVIDDRNGFTFSLAGFEETINSTINYTIQDENGCSISTSEAVVLVNESQSSDNAYFNQLGVDIRGEHFGDQIGYSVSLSADGTRMAVGAPKVGWGEVYIYERIGEDWVQMGENIIGPFWWERFGHDVALSANGNRLIVGAPLKFERGFADGYGRGDFRVYDRVGSNWNPRPISTSSYYYGYFGRTVDISNDGSIIATGRPGGREVITYKYTFDGFTLLNNQNLKGINSYGRFGDAIALSGDGTHLAVGAPADSDSIGSVQVFYREGDEWLQLGQTINGTDIYDEFGYSVAITDDGRRMVVGAPQTNIEGAMGYVRMFDWDGTDWTQAGTELQGNFPNEKFGTSLTITADGSQVIIGASNSGTTGQETGRAALYRWVGTDWQLVENIIYGGDQAQDEFGFSVASSSYGHVIAVGAIQTNGLVPNGYVRVFGQTAASFSNIFNPLCANSEPVNNLGGAFPSGGVYSGPGVSDNGDGLTFTFDPTIVGAGQTTVSYMVDTFELTNIIEILEPPVVSLTLADTLFVIAGTIQNFVGNGMPEGGVYYNEFGLFTDNDDGTTFTYSGAVDFGEIQTITYFYINENGCGSTMSKDVILFDISVNVDDLRSLSIELFPNPTKDILYLQGQGIQKVQLFDQQGKKLLLEQENVSQLDLSNLPDGAYYLLVSLNNGKTGGQQIIKG